MKTFIKFLFVLLFFNAAYCNAQDKIKVAETRSKTIKLKGEFFALNSMADGSLLFLTKKRKFWISGFNYHIYGPKGGTGRLTYLSRLSSNLKDKVEKQLPIAHLNKRINYKDLKKIGNKYVLFFTFINVKLKKEYLFQVQIDPVDLTWYGNPIYIASIPHKAKNGSLRGYFSIDLSDNGKYIIVSAYNPITVKKIWFNHRGLKSYDNDKTPKSFSFYIINDNLTIVNQRKNFRIESKKGNSLSVKTFKCDNFGNVYIIAQNVKRIKSKLKRRTMNGSDISRNSDLKIENMNFTIFKLGSDNDNIEYETDNDVFLVDLNLGFSPDNQYVDLVGIVQKELSGVEMATGVHTIRLLIEDLSEVTYETLDFQPEFIKSVNSYLIESANKVLKKKRNKRLKAEVKEQKKNYENGIPNLNSVSEVLYNSNNEVAVILEKQWLEIITESYTDGNGNRTTKTYYVWHYGELVMISGLGNKASEPAMEFIYKDEYSLTKYKSGIVVRSDQNNWILFGKNQLYKVNNETLENSSFTIKAKGENGGGRMFKARSRFRNSLFSETFIFGNKEFVGFQYQSPKKLIISKLKVS